MTSNVLMVNEFCYVQQEETNRLAFWKVSKLSPRTELRGTPATRALRVFAEGNDYKQKDASLLLDKRKKTEG